MKKLLLLISLAASGSLLCDIQREKHDEALKNLEPHINDMWYEESTTHSHSLNPNLFIETHGANAVIGSSHTTSNTTRLHFNTPEAGRAFNIYKKALSPFINKMVLKDLGKSALMGIIGGGIVSYSIEAPNELLAKIFILLVLTAPTAEVIRSNLSEKEMRYFNTDSLDIRDNLYSNLSLISFARYFTNTFIAVTAGLATGSILKK